MRSLSYCTYKKNSEWSQSNSLLSVLSLDNAGEVVPVTLFFILLPCMH